MEACPIAVIVPCYLPNEQTIIEGTIEHILTKLEWPGPVTLHVAYNTPAPLPFEETLRALNGREYAPRRVLRVTRIEGSTSKAENLNAALEYVETENVVIYDADHHPDRESLTIATAAMEAHGVQCVQGSTYLRTRPNMLAAYINAEFFVTHFVFFPAMQVRARV